MTVKRASWLFCFGSNNPSRLGKRLGRRISETLPAVLERHGRVFRGWSQTWGGGVASIVKDPDRNVYGYITPVSTSELTDVLDFYEGVHRGIYERIKVRVLVPDEKRVQAWTYKHTSSRFAAPTKEYLDEIVKTINLHWDGSIKTDDIPIV